MKGVYPGMKANDHRRWCNPISAAEFGTGVVYSLGEDYLNWLITAYGGSSGLSPGDIRLAILNTAPEYSSLDPDTQGSIECPPPHYYVKLYVPNLAGRPYAVTMNVIAHEFKHVLQHKAHPTAGCTTTPAWEAEAYAFADALIPACPGAH